MKTSRTISLVLSSAMCLLAISSCKHEDALPDSSSEKIKTTVSATDQFTKSSYAAKGILAQTVVLDEEDGLLLQEIVSDNLSQPFGDTEPDTKGTVVTTGNIATVYGQFGMEGFIDNPEEIGLTDDKYVIGGKVAYSNGTWTLTDKSGKEYPWLRNVSYSFWSFAPMAHSGTFAYVTAAGKREKMTITDYEMPTSIQDQKDLLVAFNARSYPEDKKGKAVDILFRHALADIRFDVSPISEYGLTVNEITISGANSKGDCVISSTDLYKSVEAGFDWTSNTSADFTMAGAADHFFMIPQNFSGTITISLSNGKTLTTALKTNWLAGKYYTYKLTYNGIEISVDDNVDGNVKDSVVIKSTAASTVKCYIRALIIGNWHQNLGTTSEPVPGAVMAPWSLSDGTFVGLPTTVGTAVNNWVLGADGYYYYVYPVYPDTETGTDAKGQGTPDKLFTSYTAPEDAPVAGTYLNLSIVAQAVKWDEGKTAASQAWGSTAAGYLSATDKESNSVSE